MTKTLVEARLRKAITYLDYPGDGMPPEGTGAVTVALVLELLRAALADIAPKRG